MFLRKPVTKEKIENMNKNKLFKVFVMIAFIMCSCEDNFDPKMEISFPALTEWGRQRFSIVPSAILKTFPAR